MKIAHLIINLTPSPSPISIGEGLRAEDLQISINRGEVGVAMFDSVGKEQQLMIIVLVIAIVFGCAVTIYNKFIPSGSKPVVIETKSGQTCQILVHVSGAVKRSGVYTLKSEDRILDALQSAGGCAENADLDKINLAEKPKDGQKIYIPSKNASSGDQSATVNINTASESELRKIQGVGPETAKKIIEYREKNGGFKSLEDLKKMGGFGAKKIEKIKGYISVF